jgi:hypothetical protein
MASITVICYLFMAMAKLSFGVISYNITYEIRKRLYGTILVKNIGYFDHPENSTFVLSGIM